MYKDKDKQREANRQAMRRNRTKSVAVLGDTRLNVIPDVIPERTAQGNIRVSKPGDPDYEPQCETTRACIEGRPKRPETGKRGKDIKCFTDLPLDVQQTIKKMSTNDGAVDGTELAKRTAAAIKYQHLFPDRYNSMGLSRTSSTKGARL